MSATKPSKALADYFSLFNGKNSYHEVQSSVEELFHCELKVHTAEGPVDKAGWLKIVEKHFQDGVCAAVQKIEEVNGDLNTIRYSVKLSYPNGKIIQPTSIAVFKDGKYWKHEPVDASVYSEIAAVGKFDVSGLGAAGKALVGYFSLFNGKNTWDGIQPTYESLFHPDVVVQTSDGPASKSEWMKIVEGLVANGVVATMQSCEEVEGDANRLRYSVKLEFPDGKVVEPRSTAVFKDGKYWKHEPAEPEVYAQVAAVGRVEP